MAPKAHLTIVSDNAPDSERGFIGAAATAASDAIRHRAAVSISWGAPEDPRAPARWLHQTGCRYTGVSPRGGMPERLIGAVLKTAVVSEPPGVRIPLPPPQTPW